MLWNDALGTATEVAIAIAGFSGIVAAVGRRSTGDWDPDNMMSLQALLTAAGIAMVFAFLPFLVMDTGFDPELAWRIGSGIQVAWFIGIPIFRLRQARRLGASYADFFNRAMVVLLVLVTVTLLINAAILGAAWPYVAGVLVQVTTAFIMFVRLLLGSLESAQVAGDEDLLE